MDAGLTQNKIKAALKALLKKKNHTYADLAKVWDCSVPTVKRQLGPEELPLSRLLRTLEWLSLSLSELHKLAESDDLGSAKFTAKQNEFLAKNPREFSFFMKLYEDMTPAQIAYKFKIPAPVLEKILIQLEKYDLIRVGAGGKVRPFSAKVPWVDGLLAQAHMRKIIDRMAQFQKARITEVLSMKERGLEVPMGGLSWNVGLISEKTYVQFLAKFNKLMDEFTATAKLEEKAMKKSMLKSAVINIGSFLCEHNDPNLYLATDIMDDGLLPPPPQI